MRAGIFLLLKNTAGGEPAWFPELERHCIDSIQQYDGERLDWSRYDALILTTHSDQHHLMEIRSRLDGYLAGGGTILFNGHVARPFLDELTPFEPLPRRGLTELVVNREADHPVFEGVTSDMLTLRKGVAGFYGRGTNPPPDGALVLNSVSPERWPLDWIVERPSGGRIFVHGGNDIWSFFMTGAPGNLALVQRFFDWLADTSRMSSAGALAVPDERSDTYHAG